MQWNSLMWGMIFVLYDHSPARVLTAMKKIVSYLFLCGLTFIFYSCIKNDSIVISSKADQLINKKWRLIAKQSKADSSAPIINDYDSLPDYDKDNYYLFREDSTYEYNDNAVIQPDSTSPILDTGRWEFTDNGNYLQLHSDVYTRSYNPSLIKELTETKLYLETKYPGDGSIIWTTYAPF
jgi:hypothetical protein